jgi:hypothetical protein
MTKQAEPFPMLREFARGYLHQDLLVEYGSVMEAAKAYVSDLRAAERKELAAESRQMMTSARNWKAAELNQQLHRMGAAWNFVSYDEFEQVLRFFDRGH